jgi:hypothetical protein
VIDATTGKIVGTVSLGGKPETPVLDGKGNISANIEDKNSLAEFDTKTLTISHKYPFAGCKGLPELPWTPPRVASSSAAATAT